MKDPFGLLRIATLCVLLVAPLSLGGIADAQESHNVTQTLVHP